MEASQHKALSDAILGSIAEGVFTVDENMCISYFSPTAERITGFSSGEVLGRPCREILKAELCDEGCPVEEAIRTGCCVTRPRVAIRDRDGRRIPISINAAVLRAPDGRFLGGVETFSALDPVRNVASPAGSAKLPPGLVTSSPAMKKVVSAIRDATTSRLPVCLVGRTGTHRELCALAIHRLGPASDQPFFKVNGASANRSAKPVEDGLVQAAGGTLYVEGVSELCSDAQALLERVAGPANDGTESRILVACKQEPGRLEKSGRLTPGLSKLLKKQIIRLPRLRDRSEDIPELVDYLVSRHNKRGVKHIDGINAGALEALQDHPYGGNVRELENIIEYAFVVARGGLIRLRDLPSYVAGADEARNIRGEEEYGGLCGCTPLKDTCSEETGRRPAGNKNRRNPS